MVVHPWNPRAQDDWESKASMDYVVKPYEGPGWRRRRKEKKQRVRSGLQSHCKIITQDTETSESGWYPQQPVSVVCPE